MFDDLLCKKCIVSSLTRSRRIDARQERFMTAIAWCQQSEKSQVTLSFFNSLNWVSDLSCHSIYLPAGTSCGVICNQHLPFPHKTLRKPGYRVVLHGKHVVHELDMSYSLVA